LNCSGSSRSLSRKRRVLARFVHTNVGFISVEVFASG
jgi:hypothetical protein